MDSLPDDIIEYIYKILHKNLLKFVLKQLTNRFIKWEPHLVKRFRLKLYTINE